MKTAVYRCTQRRCRAYGKEWRAAGAPQDFRLATGRPVPCPTCGAVARLVRIDEGERRAP